MKTFFIMIASAMLVSAGMVSAAEAAAEGAAAKPEAGGKVVDMQKASAMTDAELIALLASLPPAQLADVVAMAAASGDAALLDKIARCAQSAINAKPADGRGAYAAAMGKVLAVEAKIGKDGLVWITPAPREGEGGAAPIGGGALGVIPASAGDFFLPGGGTSSAKGDTEVKDASAAASRR